MGLQVGLAGVRPAREVWSLLEAWSPGSGHRELHQGRVRRR